MTDIFDQLASPFGPSEVDWRVGSTTADKTKGMALAYIDARTVMDRLDTVCGPAGWQCRYVMEGSKTVCELAVKCGEEWVWKADGAGDSDVEAEKGALSDAFKRAAVRWGIGRYLYNLKSPWVALKPMGKSFAIADEAKPQLDALLRGNKQHQADPYEENLKKAKQWVTTAKEQLSHLMTAREIDDWYGKNAQAIARLQNRYADQFKEVMHAMTEQHAGLNVKDAAE